MGCLTVYHKYKSQIKLFEDFLNYLLSVWYFYYDFVVCPRSSVFLYKGIDYCLVKICVAEIPY